MTVRELIEKLQSIPDSMKDCEVERYQCATPTHDTASIYELKANVIKYYYLKEEMSIEEAEKIDGYKTIVLM